MVLRNETHKLLISPDTLIRCKWNHTPLFSPQEKFAKENIFQDICLPLLEKQRPRKICEEYRGYFIPLFSPVACNSSKFTCFLWAQTDHVTFLCTTKNKSFKVSFSGVDTQALSRLYNNMNKYIKKSLGASAMAQQVNPPPAVLEFHELSGSSPSCY